MDFINKRFRQVDMTTLKVEIDPDYRAFKSQISPHYVCRTYNGYFFMNEDRMTVGSPDEIFKDDKLAFYLIRDFVLGAMR